MSFFGFASKSINGQLAVILLMLCGLVLTGCGAGEAADSSIQSSETEVVDNDEVENGGDGIVDDPEEPVEESHTLNLVSQPGSATISSGQSHTFQLVVEHSHPITVNWLFNGSLVQASSSTSISVSSAGSYSCVVTDGELTVDCSTFSLTVDAVQFVDITSQPSNQMVNEGADVALSVEAVGSGALSYQWYFNDSAISGATAAELALSGISVGDAGNYYCVVSTGGVSETSNAVSVVVTETPNGVAEITWTRPMSRADGTDLEESEISAYEVYYSDSDANSLTRVDTVDDSELRFVMNGLRDGTHYFALVTVDTSGLRSTRSQVIEVDIF